MIVSHNTATLAPGAICTCAVAPVCAAQQREVAASVFQKGDKRLRFTIVMGCMAGHDAASLQAGTARAAGRRNGTRPGLKRRVGEPRDPPMVLCRRPQRATG